MKKIASQFLAFFLLIVLSNTSFAQSIPELLYYKFDGSGTSIPNLALTPPAGTTTATIVGGQNQGGTGQCSGALIGNGQTSANNYVNTNWVTDLNGTSWTLSFWTSNIPSTTSTYYILGDVNANGFRVFTGGVAGAGNWILRGGFTDILATGGASTGPTLTTFVYDMPLNQMRAYVNGILVSTIGQTTVSISGPGPFMVGAYSSSNSLPASSLMDEFRLYNRALTPAEIQELLLAGSSSTITISACDSYTVPSGDETYTFSGTYMDTIPNTAGCDSVMTINLTILNSTSGSQSVSACNSYTVPSGDETYTISGTYLDTIPNIAGCDSILTINLNILNSTSILNVSACNYYIVPSGDETYTISGTYMDTIQNAAGCDSVMTINLTILNSTSNTLNVTACNYYTVPSGDETYMISGTYMDTIPNVAGCDSVITLELTINISSTSINIVTICAGDTYTINGNSYTVSAIYIDTLTGVNSCDSIVITELTVLPLPQSSQTVDLCYGTSYTIGQNTYAQEGVYIDTIPGVVFCDSIVTTTIVIQDEIDNDIQLIGLTLVADVGGDSYQWFDCNGGSLIPGATASAYEMTANGSYAVAIGIGNCTNNSDCFTMNSLGLEEMDLVENLQVYPNPNDGTFIIRSSSSQTIVMVDPLGHIIERFAIEAGKNLHINLPEITPGIYFLKSKTKVIRLVIE